MKAARLVANLEAPLETYRKYQIRIQKWMWVGFVSMPHGQRQCKVTKGTGREWVRKQLLKSKASRAGSSRESSWILAIVPGEKCSEAAHHELLMLLTETQDWAQEKLKRFCSIPGAPVRACNNGRQRHTRTAASTVIIYRFGT